MVFEPKHRLVSVKAFHGLVFGAGWVLACSAPTPEDCEIEDRDLRVVEGDGQTGAPGEVLSSLLLAQIYCRRTFDVGIVGAEVAWRVESGGGSLSQELTLSDEHGLVANRWTLGPALGSQRVAATPRDGGFLLIANFTAFAADQLPDGGVRDGGSVPPDGGAADAGSALPDAGLEPCSQDKVLVVEDHEFLDGAWTWEKQLEHSSGTGSFTTTNRDQGGALLGYQLTEMQLETIGQIWVSHFHPMVLRPQDRPIAWIRITLTGNAIQSNGNVGVGPQLIQGSKVFRAGYSLIYTAQGAVPVGGEQWQPVSDGDLLDLDATGEDIRVGYMSAISVTDTRRVAVDDWRLEVCYR